MEAPPELAEEITPARSSVSRPVSPGGGQTAAGSQEPAEPSEVGDVLGLVRAALEQGNIVVSVDGEVQGLEDAGLQGGAFDPIEIPRTDEDRP